MFAPPKENQAKAFSGKACQAEPASNTEIAPGFNSVWQSLALNTKYIQPKLAVGQAGDPYEREADRVADQVMRMPDLMGDVAQRAPVQIQRMCSECDEEEQLQRQPSQALNVAADQPEAPSEVESYLVASRGGGRPLSVSERTFFEPRFGRDFGSVRVHTDSRGAATAQAINAKAYTTGQHIVLGVGESGKGKEPDRRLLAHELVHVIQQTGVSAGPPLGLGKPVARLRPESRITPTAPRLQRQNIPRAVPLSGDGTVDPELVRLARDVRATQAGMSLQQFRQVNVATARVLVDGKAQYLSAGNLRSGPHSEEWLDSQIGELRRKHPKSSVVLEELYSERVPCKGTCRPLLTGKHPNAKIFFSTRKHGNAAAKELMKQYGVSLPAKVPKPKAGSPQGGSGTGAGSGKASTGSGTPKSRFGKAAKSVGGGVKAFGRGVGKVLPVLGGLGTFFEVRDALASLKDAKAKIAELKRELDAMWAELDKMMEDNKPPAAPPPAKISPTQSVRVYDLLRHRLRERKMDVATSSLGTSYLPISFTSLTDLDKHTIKISSSQYDCSVVLKSGIRGFRQFYNFEGYSARSDHQRLKNILSSQVKMVRLVCALVELEKQRSGQGQQPAAKPDGDEIAVQLDLLIGNMSEKISATCQGPDSGGNWTCSSDGDIAELKRIQEAGEPQDYLLVVELTRRAAGGELKYYYSLTLDTPDPGKDEQLDFSEGSVPKDACDASRYPKDSVLAYILKHYADNCDPT